jgi:hypothetical protein
MNDKLNQSLISRLKEGVKTKNLTKKEWAEELYPELEIFHALANLNSLLSGARGRGNYIFAIPIGDELILKDVTEKSEWFLYAYEKILSHTGALTNFLINMAKKLGETFPAQRNYVKKSTSIFLGDVMQKAETELGIIYEPIKK